MSSTKNSGTEMNILRPLNPFDPDTFTTYEKAIETFKCDPLKDDGEVAEDEAGEMKRESMITGIGGCTLMPYKHNYALGVQALKDQFELVEIPEIHTSIKDDGSKIIRLPTFRENLKARLDDYFSEKDSEGNKRTEGNRLRFFKAQIYSCSGVTSKTGSEKFKIIPVCQKMIEISPDFNQNYLDVSYDAVAGVELDSSKGKYNEWLTKDEVLEHPGWLAAIEEDKNLLKDYTKPVFALVKEKYKQDIGLFFQFTQNQEPDKLKALFTYDIDNNSYVHSKFGLDNYASFLRATSFVAPNAQNLFQADKNR